jgi:hypothetical protein
MDNIDVLYGFVRGWSGEPDVPGADAQQAFDGAVFAGKGSTGCACKGTGQDDRNCVWVFHTKEVVYTLLFYAVFTEKSIKKDCFQTVFGIFFLLFPF